MLFGLERALRWKQTNNPVLRRLL